MGHGFARQARLLTSADFDRVIRTGRKAYTRNLIVFAVRGESQEVRLGLAIGKRIGKAVSRNRWKRLLREVFQIGRASCRERV